MLNITILTDNNTITDKYFLGEPGLSVLIEANKKYILFDTGYSDVFLQNAQKLDKNLKSLDYIVLSHGHNDHTGGLKYLLDIYKYSNNKPQIICCPDVFMPRYDKEGEFGSPVSCYQVESVFNIEYTQIPYFITENIVFLGKIPRVNDFETQKPIGFLKDSDLPDYVSDDSAIAIKTTDGIIIVTGCSHSGIVNICEYAKSVCQNDRICSIIGGLHLKDSDTQQMDKTIDYIKKLGLKSLYAIHCSGFQAQCMLNTVSNLQEAGSGLEIKFPADL